MSKGIIMGVRMGRTVYSSLAKAEEAAAKKNKALREKAGGKRLRHRWEAHNIGGGKYNLIMD